MDYTRVTLHDRHPMNYRYIRIPGETDSLFACSGTISRRGLWTRSKGQLLQSRYDFTRMHCLDDVNALPFGSCRRQTAWQPTTQAMWDDNRHRLTVSLSALKRLLTTSHPKFAGNGCILCSEWNGGYCVHQTVHEFVNKRTELLQFSTNHATKARGAAKRLASVIHSTVYGVSH